MTSFQQLGLRDEIVQALAAQAITEPFPIQKLTIRDALAGRDICGKAKTGSGKTLAFGLPLLERLEPGAKPTRPRGLVLVPSRELARQVLDVLIPVAAVTGMRVASFYGGTRTDRDIAGLKAGVDIAVATPGRLIDLLDRRALSLRDVSMLVIDEADRMADMGFLPQVEWIMRRVGENEPQMMLFSATLDSDVDVLVRRYLHDPVLHEVASELEGGGVEEMVHRFLLVHEMDRVRVVASIAKHVTRTLVFTRTKRGADRLKAELVRENVRVKAIHGDLPQKVRERALDEFVSGGIGVLVATDVAARGIHVEGVDVVIHFDPPEEHKSYVHRSGRTARAGSSGVVATFVLWNQELEVERLKKRLGLATEPLVRVFSNDPRLADLVAFGTADDAVAS